MATLTKVLLEGTFETIEENKDIISGRLQPLWHPLQIKTITSIKWIYEV